MELVVHSGAAARPAGPVSVSIPSDRLGADGAVGLIDVKSNKPVPAQVDALGRLWLWCEALAAGEKRTYRLDPTGATRPGHRVLIDEAHPGQAEVRLDGRPFTTYEYGDATSPRPYLYPVIGPTGQPVTRSYPMRDDVENEAHDHPHQRSAWIGFGSINGENHWHQVENGATQKHRGFSVCSSGPVLGQLGAIIDWRKASGELQFTELRTYTFFRATPTARMYDVTAQFLFTERDVTFSGVELKGKEGFFSVRVAGTMTEERGGHIRNAEGMNGEKGLKGCWGKPSPWVDYYGPVAGKTVGIAIMDAPTNFRHPTRWHVRGYGLFGANPFGIRAFSGDKSKDGSHTWKAGESVTFHYRTLIHAGDTDQATVADQYALFADPPKVEVR